MVLPRIVITSGEPAGIGPDLIIKIAQQALPAEIIVIADQELLVSRAKQLNLDILITNYVPGSLPQAVSDRELKVWHVPLVAPCEAGKPNPANAKYVIETLRLAVEDCLRGEFAALVTGPVHKGIINAGGIKFSGHTEFLAELTTVTQPVMLLASDKLRVALITTHLPLSEVPKAITASLLEHVLYTLHKEMPLYFTQAPPRIAVCGLNPHAGDNGYLGKEELEIIAPTLQRLRKQGLNLLGPLAADTIFTPKNISQVDVVVAMYHDQGLPVLKYQSFGHAVNITLGLPIIRTSVDHGTAFDLAGTGKADTGSLLAAIQLAVDMAKIKSKQ